MRCSSIFCLQIPSYFSSNSSLLLMNSNDVFFILSPIFLCFFYQERLYNPSIYVLLMYLAAFIDYFRKDKCNPLLLIVEVWTELGLVVFLFALEGFPCKNYGIWFIFLLHEFIYLLLLVVSTYLILHKEIVKKSWYLLKYCEFTLTFVMRMKVLMQIVLAQKHKDK